TAEVPPVVRHTESPAIASCHSPRCRRPCRYRSSLLFQGNRSGRRPGTAPPREVQLEALAATAATAADGDVLRSWPRPFVVVPMPGAARLLVTARSMPSGGRVASWPLLSGLDRA